ncbi:TetR/AcrR family transcriptional regulator [Pseudonocardia kunmingensis]|uniref:TetR family transcriptional regulator n=1 Tax=Pseudonocardia kunmingensis TaxID=630975 RepID=A0A543DA86_9PSEU|nr:TetR/AcrR family transcriptional regulator [Pseudonocardia kunmingensis]TQM06237.1 TetR family transcriptional regulator [Pseudonocardia kunmingensis]
MDEHLGLRERKKARTRRAISEAAIALFLERGYDDVPVAEIAAAAEVSKRTLFAYFPTKDDLVLHRFADHEDEAARVVRDRAAGEPPLDALQRHLHDALDRHDPISGLCDVPQVVAFYRLVSDTPALRATLLRYQVRSVESLASALLTAAPQAPHPQLTARLAANQIQAVLRELADDNQQRIAAGTNAEDLAPVARAEADHAFTLLRAGLTPYATEPRATSP